MASLDELLGQIVADVHDLGARAVYADALIEAGDPRGELIALQLERTRTGDRATPREVELLHDHRDGWLGPIAPVLARHRFENGFLYEAQLRAYPLTPALIEHREWRTLEHLDARHARSADAVLLDDNAAIGAGEPTASLVAELIARLPQLATLDVHAPQLEAIRARVTGHALERLGVALTGTDPAQLDELLRARTFDRLNRLRLLALDPVRIVSQVVSAARCAGTAVELELLLGPAPRALAEILDRGVADVRAITVLAPWGRIRATHADGAIVVALFDWPAGRPDIVPPPLRETLEVLGPGRVIVRLAPGIPPEAAPSLAGFRVEAS